MKIAMDKNQISTASHRKSNNRKHVDLIGMGIELIPVPLPFGDYCMVTSNFEETMQRRGASLKKADLVGDIKVTIDTKKNLLEVAQNICTSSHNRFRDEVILAQKCNCKMIVLVEEADIKSINDVFKWKNPRMERYNKINYMHKLGKWNDIPIPKKPPTNGQTLAKAMITMQHKYNVIWEFSDRNEAAERIVELLKENNK